MLESSHCLRMWNVDIFSVLNPIKAPRNACCLSNEITKLLKRFGDHDCDFDSMIAASKEFYDFYTVSPETICDGFSLPGRLWPPFSCLVPASSVLVLCYVSVVVH